VRVHPRRPTEVEELSRRAVRLPRLPLRPVTARVVSRAGDASGDDESTGSEFDYSQLRSTCELDPGWVQSMHARVDRLDALSVIAEAAWWPIAAMPGPVTDVLGLLWRHSVAVATAARWLARDAGERDPDQVARAGLLSRLGCWAVAAVEPDWLVRWWQVTDSVNRRKFEIADLGTDLDDLGRRLAERWGLSPLTIDAVWLHAEHGRSLKSSANDPDRLEFIQEAQRWVERTPFSLTRRLSHETMPSEPRLRILVAEVQARCGSAFVAADATPHEEQVTRQNASLRLQLIEARREQAAANRLLLSLAQADPADSPEDWAARAALAWCAAPEVSSARVLWLEPLSAPMAEHPPTAPPPSAPEASPPARNERPPTLILPLEHRGSARALIQLWSDRERSELETRLTGASSVAPWRSWAALVADRALLERRLQSVVASFRDQIDTEDARLRDRKLDALAEFAGGAGHELNNPLAVIVGRAQLLLARTSDPEMARSLEIIRNQASRAHGILRDLMFVARPPALRPRSIHLPELLKTGLRELDGECTARGIRLETEVADSLPAVSADPEALRHLIEILVHNALEATPSGGKILVRICRQGNDLVISVADTGKGFGPGEAVHLLDPFYCGRRAGRGLGLGLPRAARIAATSGGQLSWTSTPGHGSIFQVHLLRCGQPESDNAPKGSRRPSKENGNIAARA
jgi:signal transduction histidine kinase